VQTTVGSHNLGELEAIADFAHDRLAAKVWNLYFLVPTGRGQFVSDITPAQYDEVLASLYRIQRKYDRRMLVNAKCAPHYIKTVLERAEATGGGAPRAMENAGTQAGAIPTDARLRQGYGGQAESASGPWPGVSQIRTYSGGAGGCPAGTHYMGIRPNGDVTPCPYLPVFAGTLRSSTLADLWTSSGLFADIRRRSSLGGRCGACEMNAHCGGCRARAYGMTGDLMAEDPLCTHTPGKFAGSPLLAIRGRASVAGGQGTPAIEYGPESPTTIPWDDAAAARMKKIPAFVRGMVVRAVEESCRKSGLDRVTVDELDRIRSRMPTPKIFG
jgi:radical SAM protein with 4Fe4S-binding SPASM domain